MLEQYCEGLNDVIVNKNKVFVNVDDGLERQEMALLVGRKEYPFEEIAPHFARRFDFGERFNTAITLDPLQDTSGKLTPQAVLNTLLDWCVPGCDTLQLELDKHSAPSRILFPRKIHVAGARDALRFRARIATHRAVANLIVTVADNDTGAVETHSVRFDPAFLGGTRLTGFQFVDVALPAGTRHADVEIAIEYLACTDKINPSKPYLFLCDSHVLEGEEGDFSEDLIDLAASTGTWLSAEAKVDLEGLVYPALRIGKRESVIITKPVGNARGYFDELWYEKQCPDEDFENIDVYSHYLLRGWREGKSPNRDLIVREYLLRNPDVEAAGVEPLMHYANIGQREGRSIGGFEATLMEIWRHTGKSIPQVDELTILRRVQDFMVPMEIVNTRKLAVFVIPEHNAMSGGIYSMFSIADHVRRTRRAHGFDVVMLTRPNPLNMTYVRNSSFRNSETVLNIEQLRLFANVSELQIHVPEYSSVEFVRYLSPELVNYITSRDNVHVNILNQNTRLMPEAHKFRDLRRIADTIGQSVSHHAYFGQEFADQYNLASLLLPAYTDLSQYPPSKFSEKESIIIYSDDDAIYREPVMKKLREMKDYQLIKIRDMTFDLYMEYATRCRFSVSFGEGFDGYVAQPMYQGGIGLALYTDEFFPDATYKSFDNFFESEEEMIDRIVPTIRRLEADQAAYEALNRGLRAKWDELYDYDDYVARIAKLINKEYEIFPAGGA